MSSEVYLVVEGATEQLFVERVLAPYCAIHGIYLHPTQVPKKGEKGGDVRFARVKTCVGNFLMIKSVDNGDPDEPRRIKRQSQEKECESEISVLEWDVGCG